MKKESYKEFIITSEPFIPEILSSILWELETEGIVEEENSIILYSKPDLTKQKIESMLHRLVEEKLISSFTVSESFIENKNWNEEWEKGIQPIEVTDKIVIKPSFKTYNEKEGQIIITIDPKMSFGTGEHQTTKLVVQLLEKHTPLKGKVLDVGTGTGILAIVSLKLGASKSLAIDNDEWCIENAEENISLNNVEDQCSFLLAEINDVIENNYDLVIANIQKNVLLDISGSIKEKVKNNGLVILSGLLVHDKVDIISNYQNLGFVLIDEKQMDEWIALVFRLNN